MNLKLIIVALLLCVESIPVQDTEKLSKEYIGKVDFIGTAVIKKSPSSGKLVVSFVKVFKGHRDSRNAYVTGYDFQEGERYLIYAQQGQDEELIVNQDSKTKLLEVAEEDLKFLKENIYCIQSSLMTDGACHRVYFPVCGCDSITYGNTCEARKRGVAIYTFGECNKN